MVPSEIRSRIHKLVDEADESQLGALLEVLEPSSTQYSQEDLDSFYNRIKLLEQNGSKGFSLEESHAQIRNRHKQHGL